MTITTEDMLACVKRELGQRRRVYPRLVGCGKMTQAGANREISTMQAIADKLQQELEGNDLFGGAR
jgi:hypothetical protein